MLAGDEAGLRVFCRLRGSSYTLQQQTLLITAVMLVETWDEIFKFESFTNFVKFLKYLKTPFLKFSLKVCILIIIHL